MRPAWLGGKEPVPRPRRGESRRPTAASPAPLSCRRFRPHSPGALLELPNQHRIPLAWLLENAGASIGYRTLTELAPAGYATPEAIEAAHLAVSESKTALAVVKKQKDKFVAERYHQPSDEILPWFTYDGALQQLRVTIRTAMSVANAPVQPQWEPTSEFREAGQARRKGARS